MSLYLTKLQLINFKGFAGQNPPITFHGPDGVTPGSGLNILVGENNGGKSTIFSAIRFLYDGSGTDPILTQSVGNKEDGGVIATFESDNISEVLSTHIPNKKHVPTTIDLTNQNTIRLRRTISNKKYLYALNKDDSFNSEGHNPTGIDSLLKSCFNLFEISASDDPEKLSSYSPNSLTKGLLEDIFKEAHQSPEFSEFVEVFDKCFNGEESSLKRQMSSIATNVSNEICNMFGEGKVSFKFPTPEINSIFKSINLNIDTTGNDLKMTNHGQGMQRSVAFALLKVWADIQEERPKNEIPKPYAFILDEPEICIHPRAQSKLLSTLVEISKHHQVFLATHSPIFLHSHEIKDANVILCEKIENAREISQIKQFSHLFSWSPSWGEISWFAYKIPTVEFHNELYGAIEAILRDHKDEYIEFKERNSFKVLELSLDQWFKNHAINYIGHEPNTEIWAKNGSGKPEENRRTIYLAVRNAIHHPENTKTSPAPNAVINTHIRESTQDLILILQGLKSEYKLA